MLGLVYGLGIGLGCRVSFRVRVRVPSQISISSAVITFAMLFRGRVCGLGHLWQVSLAFRVSVKSLVRPCSVHFDLDQTCQRPGRRREHVWSGPDCRRFVVEFETCIIGLGSPAERMHGLIQRLYSIFIPHLYEYRSAYSHARNKHIVEQF